MTSQKPKVLQKSLFSLLIPLPLLSLLFLHRSAPPPTCPHILLFTQARHGSTWLIDSVERCRFSRTEQVEPGIYGKRVYLDTELWHIHDTHLKDLPVADVIEYLVANCSLKIFPTTLTQKKDEVTKLLREIGTDARLPKVPVVVLRRDTAAAWSSLKSAEESGQWAFVKGQTGNATAVKRTESEGDREVFGAWERETKNYFGDVARLLGDAGIPADWLWYEDVAQRPWVELRTARCWVKNCNFL